MVKVSVIVPIYNSEKCIKETIESICNQKLRDLEIILVNDGSNDNSLAICMKYKSLDSRIKVVNKNNSGVSSARNAGLRVATGEYIGFVDAGDTIDIDMYKNMYRKLEKYKADIAICNYYSVINDNKIPVILPFDTKILKRDNINELLVSNMIGSDDLNSNGNVIMGSVWRLLIKRNLIVNQNILFNEKIPLMEDLIFCIETFISAESVVVDENTYYHYICSEDSCMRKFRENMLEIRMEVISDIEEILKQNGLYEKMEARLNIFYVNQIILSICNEVSSQSKKSNIKKITNIYDICKDKKLNRILNDIDFKGYTLRKRIILIAIKNNWAIYIYIYYTILTNYISKI